MKSGGWKNRGNSWSELVARFANPSNLQKYEEKTHTCAVNTHMEHTGNKCCLHAHSHSTSVKACHAFFSPHYPRMQLLADSMTKARSFYAPENSQPVQSLNTRNASWME